MYKILLTPKNRSIAPHFWKEGGKFKTKESAEFQAQQTRKMKDLYVRVEVMPADAQMFHVKTLTGEFQGAYLVFKTNTAMAKSRGHKYALRYSGGVTICTYPTKEDAINGAKKLSA